MIGGLIFGLPLIFAGCLMMSTVEKLSISLISLEH